MAARRLLLILAITLMGISLSCNLTGQTGPESLIVNFSGDSDREDEEFGALEEAIDIAPEEIRLAAMEHLEDENKNVRFAALYVIARTAAAGESMEALVPFLKSSDISERITAAEALLVRGDKAAFPALIDALDSSAFLNFRDPPQQAWEAASFALIQFTDEDLGLLGVEDIAGSAAAKPAWEAWWQSNAEALIWNADVGVYRK